MTFVTYKLIDYKLSINCSAISLVGGSLGPGMGCSQAVVCRSACVMSG